MNKFKSKIIAIEGTDGSGKATQTKILADKLKELGQMIYTTSFPNYESDSSALVKMYLKGEIVDKAGNVSAKAASVFYAADRYITYQKEMKRYYESGAYIMLFDRYVASNIIHQGAKLVTNEDDTSLQEEKLKEFVKWLDGLEHLDFEIPRADITIYLRVPVEYTEKMREGRANEITGGQKQDIHEADISHLRNASKSGDMASLILGWDVIECGKDGKMKSIEEISEEIFDLVKAKILNI